MLKQDNFTIARTIGATKKKKNTYIVSLNNPLYDASGWGLRRSTKLAIMSKNGEQMFNPYNAWCEVSDFPNPAAHHMVTEYKTLAPLMNRTAQTVIEYLDKDNGEPVLMVFPSEIHVFDCYKNDYMSHLNHATRRDFKFQLKKREELLAKIKMDKSFTL